MNYNILNFFLFFKYNYSHIKKFLLKGFIFVVFMCFIFFFSKVLKTNFIILFYFFFPLFQIVVFFFLHTFASYNMAKNSLIFLASINILNSLYLLKNINILNISHFFEEHLYFFDLEFFSFTIYLDNMNLYFLILTSLLNLTCYIYLFKFNKNTKKKKECISIIMIIHFILNFLFMTTNLFIFYIFFEIILIPFLFLIAIWGARSRKIHASIQFFIFTLLSSMFVLILIIYLFQRFNTLEIKIFTNIYISIFEEKIIWILFFLGLSAKIPIIPFHFWLPEAHVEAPTVGSVILAGILLKLGGYGFLKFLITYTTNACFFFFPIIGIIGAVGLIYGSLSTLRQIDLKKIIAYSSIVHMNYGILGLFSNNFFGIFGSFFMMLTHGLIASAFFFSIGFLYERYHTRILKYFRGLNNFMPIFSFFFFFLTLNNAGFPLTASFIGEFFILMNITSLSLIFTIIISFGLILTCVYAFWLFTRIFFGNFNKYNFDNKKILLNFLNYYNDLTLKEILILFIFVFLSFFLTFYNNIIIDNLVLNLEYKFIDKFCNCTEFN